MHTDDHNTMSIIAEIRKTIGSFPEDYMFMASDFSLNSKNPAAVVKALNRLAQAGEISKMGKGKFYKPRKSQFGILKPTAYRLYRLQGVRAYYADFFLYSDRNE